MISKCTKLLKKQNYKEKESKYSHLETAHINSRYREKKVDSLDLREPYTALKFF